MQFKHPEVLYFLFLLAIPVIVHLFQLRRFKKEYFTNVKFLQELVVETTKSSKIKKYLLLATRLLLLSCLIFAFAQPFFKAIDSESKNNSFFIVLDNSFSMQAKGEQGELLKRSIQEILEYTPENFELSIISNDQDFWNTNIKTIEQDLQHLNYSPLPFSIENALAKVKTHNGNVGKDIVFITDAIGIKAQPLENLPDNVKTHFIIPEAEKTSNVAIDSVFITQSLDNFYEVGVAISNNFEDQKSIPISMFNKDNLVAKTILKLDKRKQTIQFTIPKDEFNGYVTLNDNSLSFDNTFYFKIPKPKKIHVLSIGNPEESGFLRRIYTQPDFEYQNFTTSTLDYRLIEKQDCIVLNELESIPQAMHTNLKKFIEKGGSVVFIPSLNCELSNLNSFMNVFGNLQFTNLENVEKKITKINFSNPLFANVFEKNISNFQYPKVAQSFNLKSKLSQAIAFEDQSGFLNTFYKNNGAFYIFSAPINKENSNFQNSPLIVPTFYKMAVTNDRNGVQYQVIGKNNPFLIDAQVGKDEVISIKNENEDFIPMQQILDDKVKISCGDNPKNAGMFEIIQNKKSVGNLSFNFDRKESLLTQPSDESLNNLNKIDSLDNFFETIQIERTDNQIWKWFLIFALLFFIIEMLIQKIVK